MGGYELIMPFLPVESQGGPYDDLAYSAGFEMGALYAKLGQDKPAPQTITVHRDNHQQADLIAMRHGYTTEFQSEDEGGWVCLALTPAKLDLGGSTQFPGTGLGPQG